MFANKGYSRGLFGMPLRLWDTHFAGTLYHLLPQGTPVTLLNLFTHPQWPLPNLADWAALAHNQIPQIISIL